MGQYNRKNKITEKYECLPESQIMSDDIVLSYENYKYNKYQQYAVYDQSEGNIKMCGCFQENKIPHKFVAHRRNIVCEQGTKCAPNSENTITGVNDCTQSLFEEYTTLKIYDVSQ